MEKPLENLVTNGGMMNIFNNICVIGDSLSSGCLEYNLPNNERGYWDCYEYSWPKKLEQLTGIRTSNASRCGLTAYSLYKEANDKTSYNNEINALFDNNNAKQAYIIALGVNDLLTDNMLQEVYNGNIGDVKTDIDLENYNNNALSFVGCYAKIIQRLQSFTPDSKIFLVTIPHEDRTPEYASKLIYDIANLFTNCYVIDLYKDAPRYDKDFCKKYFDGHMNCLGYMLTAYYIMTYINWLIRNNIDEFRYVPFIGTGLDPFKSNQ